MQVMKINNDMQPQFRAIKADSVKDILKTNRLVGLTTGRKEEYKELVKEQENNPIDIFLTKGLFKSLKAKIVDSNGCCLWMYKESIFDGMLNNNPNKFIYKMCQMANYFNKNSKKQTLSIK